MQENPYQSDSSSTSEPLSARNADIGTHASAGSIDVEQSAKTLLLEVTSWQKTTAILGLALAQIALLGYFALTLYTSYLVGTSPSPFQFLFVFITFTFLPTVCCVFLFRCSQLNRDWAIGKGTAEVALSASTRLYKSVAASIGIYFVLSILMAASMIGLIPSPF